MHEIEAIESQVEYTPNNRNHVRDSWWYLDRRLAGHMRELEKEQRGDVVQDKSAEDGYNHKSGVKMSEKYRSAAVSGPINMLVVVENR